MGNSLSHLRSARTPPSSNLPTTPTGLYPTDIWNVGVVRRLIYRNRLAPRFHGSDTCTPSTPEACPICLQHYPALNATKCCNQGICTECYLQVRPPPRRYMTHNQVDECGGGGSGGSGSGGGGGIVLGLGMADVLDVIGRMRGGGTGFTYPGGTRSGDCPFCKVRKVVVVYRGVKGGDVVEKELKEKERVGRLLKERRAKGRSSTAREEQEDGRKKGEDGKKEPREGRGRARSGRVERNGRGHNGMNARSARSSRRSERVRVRRFVVPEPVRENEEMRRRYAVTEAGADGGRFQASLADLRTIEWVRELQSRLGDVDPERVRYLSSPSLRLERRLRQGEGSFNSGSQGWSTGESSDAVMASSSGSDKRGGVGGHRETSEREVNTNTSSNRKPEGTRRRGTSRSVRCNARAIESAMLETALRRSLLVK